MISHEGTKARKDAEPMERSGKECLSFVPSCLRVRNKYPSPGNGQWSCQDNGVPKWSLGTRGNPFFAALRLCVRFFLCSALAMVALGTVTFAEEPFPKGWSPDLSEVATMLKGELQDASNQREINRISSRLAEVSDAQLAIIYIQLWHQIPKPDQSLLAKEQAAWIKMREKAATEASQSEEGGSLSAYDYSAEFLKLTESRINLLKGRLKPSANKTTK